MSDTEKFINCPACGEKMKKVVCVENNFFIDVCSEGCGGVWFDNRELGKCDENSENIDELKNILNGKTFKTVDKDKTRICPVCGAKMIKNFVSAKHKIQIDECYSCGGKFFDYKELDKMRSQYDSDEERTQAVLESFEKQYSADLAIHSIEMSKIKPSKAKKAFDKLFGKIINSTILKI